MGLISMYHTLNNKRGFTLTELLVAMALSAVVMAAIGSVYYTQQKSYLVQDQLAAAQQNLRAGMYFIEREIRMAGCDPTQNANARILTANNATINFTLDITNSSGTGNPDGLTDGPNENITYLLGDSDGDGDNDLLRNGNLIAENIDALNFVYLDGASPPNVLDDDGSGNVTTNIPNIQSVQVTVVARTGREDRGYTDTNDYRNLQDSVILAATNDHFRRKQLNTTCKLRN
jgi:type IV pilus assembly protein PilW